MEVDEPEDDGRANICLKHSKTWRNKFQHLLNLLRNNPFHEEIIYKIGKKVCICDPDNRSQEWQERSEDDHRAAQEHFESFIDGKDHCSDMYSHLRFHFKQMKNRNLLGDGDTSAKRFIYLFYKVDHSKDLTLLGPFRLVENRGPPSTEFEFPLTKLKKEYIGVFIGKKGHTLKENLKRFKCSKVTVKENGGTLTASISCREKDKSEIINIITKHEEEVVEKRKGHEQRVQEYNSRTPNTNPTEEMETEDPSGGNA